MNWLKKITISRLHARFGAFKLLICCAALLLVVAVMSYQAGNFYQKHQNRMIAEQTERLEKLYQKNEQAISQINTLQVELAIERLANQKMQQAFRTIEDDHFSLKKELAFYEKIMAPEKQANGIIIDEVEIAATNSPNHYRIRVVLVQQQKSKRYAKGHLKVTFDGSLVNRPATVNIANISELDQKALSFSFQYFQVIEGEFTLPDDFIPEKIDVSAILPAGRWQKQHRLDETYPWLSKKES
ncbi:DUF6776 family protein [Thalassotalea sp. ND16A]|uniref:DUF6776 family protein n=1 Tax=Thalassotalea sp. ND16A TaxID=1535422 RepID=UPI00051A82F1|nr:DUF6776 family protein [Thalassotalea sp. ND16A]KGJ99366.1 hypothetical protein ND16A_3887 [Thalassotalea sp. ND16A]